MMDFKWSDSEKKVARRAFDCALERERAAIMVKVKALAAKTENSEDVWGIHDYLSAQRREFDRKYDYRYSQLILVFVRLLREGWLEEKDLDGLREDKREAIRKIISF